MYSGILVRTDCMKTTIALLVLFFFILGGGYLLSNRGQVAATPTYTAPIQTSTTTIQNTVSTPTPPLSPTPPKDSYTSAQVASHNTSINCWTSISGSVYDLTAWISQHPGGEAVILSICGRDGTQAFLSQHGNPRDTRPEAILATFRIGVLAS